LTIQKRRNEGGGQLPEKLFEQPGHHEDTTFVQVHVFTRVKFFLKECVSPRKEGGRDVRAGETEGGRSPKVCQGRTEKGSRGEKGN
jgi:hypothetical protein